MGGFAHGGAGGDVGLGPAPAPPRPPQVGLSGGVVLRLTCPRLVRARWWVRPLWSSSGLCPGNLGCRPEVLPQQLRREVVRRLGSITAEVTQPGEKWGGGAWT